MNKFLIILKSWYGVLILALLAGGVLWFVLNGMPFLNDFRANWEAKRLQAQWEKPYREDKYGGKTPEETYDMFLDALRKGDTTLASKYFEIEDKEGWKKTFEEYKNQNILINFVKEVETIKSKWQASQQSDLDLKEYTYTFELEQGKQVDFNGEKINLNAGTYRNSITFQRYLSGVWKISSL